MTITYRTTKGSALTYGEVDENFRDLYEDTDLQRVLTNGNISTLSMTVNSITLTASSPPASATAAGTPGQIAWNSGFIYVCVANNTWKRAALTTWP
jgi:hypothetical protein